MDRQRATKVAEAILALINASPRTPSKEQIANVVLGVPADAQPFPPEVLIAVSTLNMADPRYQAAGVDTLLLMQLMQQATSEIELMGPNLRLLR